MSQQQQPPEGEAPPGAAFDTSGQVRGGPLLTLAIPQLLASGVAGVRLLIAHATGHDDHVFDSDLARRTAEQLLAAADVAEEANRKKIDTYGPEALRDLGPPGNGAGGLHVPGA